MSSFRAFAGGKPTWILNYSWDGDKTIAPRDAMENLFMSQVMAGANVWDARGHVMSGSNDLDTRKRIFAWIARHEKTLYRPRVPLKSIGVYFSPQTRNYFPAEFLRSYQGILILLMQQHLAYTIVTPRTLAEFKGSALILPDVRVLDASERTALKAFAGSGGKLVITGADVTGLPQQKEISRLQECPGKAYLQALESNFETASPSSQTEFLQTLPATDEIKVEGSPALATHIVNVDSKLHVFFASFKGLRGGKNAQQEPEAGVRITLNAGGKAKFLPFLGEEQELKGERKGKATVYQLPPITRGGIFWVE
jgi:hypothetical protein